MISIKRKAKKAGFTLIELLVVISIVALLSAIVLAAVTNARSKSQKAAGQQFATSLYHAYGADAYLYWNFSEADTSTTVTDISSNNCTGTLTAGGTANRSSSITANSNSKSFYFNGSTGITATCSSISHLDQSYTVSVWVYPTDPADSTAQNIIATTKDDGVTMRFAGNSGNNQILNIGYQPVGGVAGFNQFTTSVPLNQWTNLAYSYNYSSNTYSFYVNGAFVGKAVRTSTNPPGGTIYLGVGFWLDNYYIGYMDDFAIYNQALASNDIYNMYAEAITKHLARK